MSYRERNKSGSSARDNERGKKPNQRDQRGGAKKGQRGDPIVITTNLHEKGDLAQIGYIGAIQRHMQKHEEMVGKPPYKRVIYDELFRIIRTKAVKISFENLAPKPEEDLDMGRVILSLKGSYRQSATNHPLNGLILDAKDSWRVLVYPIKTAINQKRGRFVNNLFRDDSCYNINFYPLLNGTVVNLYYYNNKWVVSTANAYEANDYQWKSPGNNTYYEIISDLLGQQGVDFSALNKLYCYSFIMAYKPMHRIIHTADSSVTLCQVWDISEQCLEDYIEEGKRLGLKYIYEPISHPTRADFLNNNDNALAKYLAHETDKRSIIQGSSKKCPDYLATFDDSRPDNFSPHFGYLVTYEKNGYKYNLMATSSLFDFIKNTLFTFPGWFKANDLFFDGLYKDIFIVVRILLQPNRKYDFIICFPEYEKLLITAEQFLESLINKIHNILLEYSRARAKSENADQYSGAKHHAHIANILGNDYDFSAKGANVVTAQKCQDIDYVAKAYIYSNIGIIFGGQGGSRRQNSNRSARVIRSVPHGIKSLIRDIVMDGDNILNHVNFIFHNMKKY